LPHILLRQFAKDDGLLPARPLLVGRHFGLHSMLQTNWPILDFALFCVECRQK
jgi:hypothetical protein